MSKALFKKLALPPSVRVFSLPGLRAIPETLEAISTTLQSKRGGCSNSQWQEIANALQFIRRPDPLIFDVGANAGHWTTAMGRRFQGRAAIRMFEPQPQCWSRLKGKTGAHVTLEKTAVSDHDGALTFHVGQNAELASAHARSDFKDIDITKTIEVPCVRLDSYIAANNLSTVDFVKMDIEGHELQGIKGAEDSLMQGCIKAISFEFGSSNVNSRTYFIDFFEYFTSRKFMVYRLGHDGIPIAISRYSRSLEYFNGVANYVASSAPPRRFRTL